MIGEWSNWGDVDILVGFPMVYLAMTCMSRLRLSKENGERRMEKGDKSGEFAGLQLGSDDIYIKRTFRF